MAEIKLSADTIRMMRHMVAAIAYRSSRSLRDAPAGFGDVRLSDDSMSAKELVLHMSNVTAFAIATVAHAERIRHAPLEWEGEVARFYALLGELDAKLAAGVSLDEGIDLKLVQGPLADALTHVGQLHSMRRKSGKPIGPENYIKADIRTGRVALADQP